MRWVEFIWLKNIISYHQVLNAAAVNVGAFISNHMKRWLTALVCIVYVFVHVFVYVFMIVYVSVFVSVFVYVFVYVHMGGTTAHCYGHFEWNFLSPKNGG